MSHGFTKDYLVKATGETEIFVNGTKQDSTSGSTIDFTIPSGVKKFTVSLDQVSTSGTYQWGFQLGDAGGIENTGYNASGWFVATSSQGLANYTDRFGLRSGGSGNILSGNYTFTLLDAATNTWSMSGSMVNPTSSAGYSAAGSKSLSGELTTLRVVTTDTFDNGSVNVQYENPNLAVSGVESVAAGVTDVFVNGVKQASTSGTSIDFTVPSGIKEFKLGFSGISCDASTNLIVQLGDAGGVETSGYLGGYSNDVGTVRTNNSSGFIFASTSSATTVHGLMSFALQDSATNTWVGGGTPRNSNNVGGHVCGGEKPLSGELTTVRITTSSGTGNFDAGSINIQYDNQDLDLGSGVVNGGVVQTVHTQDGELATGTGTIPNDDTIPQNTEGTEFITCSVTPTDAANKLKVEVVFCGASSAGSTGHVICALFQDSTADAIAVAKAIKDTSANTDAHTAFTYWMTAGTTSSTTFKLRAGSSVAGTTSFNGQSGGRKFGGRYVSSITITEYKV